MALDDLLAKLEGTPALSKSGVAQVSGVQASNGAGCGCNPSEIDGVARVADATVTGAPATPATPAENMGLQAKPLPALGCTPATPATPQNDKGEAVTARAWLLHFADRDPLEVWFAPPATHPEALAGYPDALAAEPLPERAAPPPAKNCRYCAHQRQPGIGNRHCAAGRDDLLPAYGPGHPLRKLPADMGVTCASYQTFEE